MKNQVYFPHFRALSRVLIVLIEEYSVFCTITADTSEVAKSLKLQRRPDGKSYFTLDYNIILLFGRTELRAQFSWKENVSKVTDA